MSEKPGSCQFLSNPLHRFSHFRVAPEELKSINALIQRLCQIAELIFEQGDTSLSAHFRQLKEILFEAPGTPDLLQEEEALLEGLQQRLKAGSHEELSVAASDLAEAIRIFLGGDLAEDDEEEIAGEHDTQGEFLNRFESLDGIAFCPHDREIHVCTMGEEAIPRQNTQLTWPVDGSQLEGTSQPTSLKLLRQRERSASEASIMLFFQALVWAKKLSVSWISDRRGEYENPSVLLLLLATSLQQQAAAENADLNNLLTMFENPSSEWQPRPESAPKQLVEEASAKFQEALPDEVLASYEVCPRRFVYSFVANEYPSFDSDFHHGFLYGKLVNLLAMLGDFDPDAMQSQLKLLFPQWTEVRARSEYESSRKYKVSPKRDRYDGAEYLRENAWLQFLLPIEQTRDGLRLAGVLGTPPGQELQQKWKQLREDAESDTNSLPEVLTGKHCSFCPYNNVCPDSPSSQELKREEKERWRDS